MTVNCRSGPLISRVPAGKFLATVPGAEQRGHVHALLMPDRRHILFTGPDERTETSHLFLLDVSDLADARIDRDEGLSDRRQEWG